MDKPKLKIYGLDTSDLVEDTTLPTNVVIDSFISKKSLKSSIDFYNNYKNNPMLFFKDFPKEQKDNAISNIRMNIEMKWISCKVNNIEFKDWLFELLFKME